MDSILHCFIITKKQGLRVSPLPNPRVFCAKLAEQDFLKNKPNTDIHVNIRDSSRVLLIVQLKAFGHSCDTLAESLVKVFLDFSILTVHLMHAIQLSMKTTNVFSRLVSSFKKLKTTSIREILTYEKIYIKRGMTFALTARRTRNAVIPEQQHVKRVCKMKIQKLCPYQYLSKQNTSTTTLIHCSKTFIVCEIISPPHSTMLQHDCCRLHPRSKW